MFYHVFVKDDATVPPGDCDLESEDVVIREYYVKYMNGEVFDVKGRKFTDKDVRGLEVFRTQENVKTLVSKAGL